MHDAEDLTVRKKHFPLEKFLAKVWEFGSYWSVIVIPLALLSAHDISHHAEALVSLNICKLCFKFLRELSEC